MANSVERGGRHKITEYEIYIRTEELLSLQKPESELSHHDELQFLVVHQTFELWWKDVEHELRAVKRLLGAGDYFEAARLMDRAVQIQKLLLQVMGMLETMAPQDFLTIRAGLGRGSGMDSPGFRRLMRLSPTLLDDLTQALEREGVSLIDIYAYRTRYIGLFEVAEGMLNYDEYFQLFRSQHYRLAQRMIGPRTVGTGGTPVPTLQDTLTDQFYPELWEVRNALTQRATQAQAGKALAD